MRGFGKALAVIAAVMALAFGLVACGGSAGPGGPVYLKTKQVYYDTSDGSVQSEMTWTYDERGNKVKRVTKTAGNGSEMTVEDAYSDFDQDGYPASHSATNGSETKDSTFEYTKENGRIVKAVESSGSETSYTYYENGQVKTMESTFSSGTTTLYEYDGNGYLIRSSSSGGGNEGNRTIMWTMDDDGVPVGMVYNSASSGKSQAPVSYTAQCDDDGNIIRVYTALGKLYEEIEYAKIENPTPAAWIEAHMISG